MAQTVPPSERGRGRPTKPVGERSRNAGFAAYPPEIRAIRRVSKAKGFVAPFDYVRALVIDDGHPLAAGKIREPARAKSQS